ncbi:MAG: translocation and assembly module TamB, partial [Alphaproteobacteria bacterium]
GELEFTGNVAVIEKLFPIDPHRIRGNLRASAMVAGTVAKPIVTGNATLADGGYENIEIGTLFEKVDATIEFLEGRATVRATALDGGSGRINLNGHIELAQPRSLDLVLRMDNVTLVRRDEVVAALSGDIFASGGFGDLLVSGQVETNTIEVRLIDALPPEIVRLDVEEIGLRRSGTPKPPRATKDAFAARLEIGVAIPKQLFVRGRGLDSEWQGNLRVLGSTADAEVTGSLSAVRGQFSFAGKTFKLVKGVIDIDERDGEFAAILDVQTEFTDDDFVAKVNVTGPATKPEIVLTSTPELPRDEVLARILFGRGTGQLSPIEALQLAEAAASLSGIGGASTGVLDKVRSALGVDVLQVDAGEGDAGPTVRAGKYVADGVFVGAKQGAGPGASSATVEIELTPNISLESEVGQTGRSRAGVNWQFNY